MRSFSVSPVEMFYSLWRNRELIKASTRREVLGRYRGSALGMLWSFFNPLIMLLVFTFLFSVVFQARWGNGDGTKAEFAVVLFAGLMVFNLFSECINKAPGLILSNVNYVKKVVFPLEVLPVVSMLSAFFHVVVSLGVWILIYWVLFGVPHVTVLYFPLIVFPFLMFILGVSWALASLGVYLRDVAQVIGVFTSTLMFLSPIFYPVSALPEEYRYLLFLNPLTPVVEMTRDVLCWGNTPDLAVLAACWLVAFIVAWIGFFWFQKTRRGFADVL